MDDVRTTIARLRMVPPTKVAEMLGVTTRTLSNWRYQGTGPRYTKLGSLVRYPLADLVDYIDANAKNAA